MIDGNPEGVSFCEVGGKRSVIAKNICSLQIGKITHFNVLCLISLASECFVIGKIASASFLISKNNISMFSDCQNKNCSNVYLPNVNEYFVMAKKKIKFLLSTKLILTIIF